MKKYFIFLGSIGAAGLMIAGLVRSNHGSADFRLTTVAPRSFDITVDAIGVLDAARSHMVSSTIRGDRGKIIYLIADGIRVK